MNMDYKSIGLEENSLYEVLATTFSIESENQFVPNTASMGIRILNNGLISMSPYPSTKTFQNLNQIPLVTLNFVDNIFLYALTSLKGSNMLNNIKGEKENFYDYYQLKSLTHFKDQLKAKKLQESFSIPFIKDSWAILISEVKMRNNRHKEDEFGMLKLTEFLLSPILIKKFRESYKLFNRAENITLETIILATRLKVAFEVKDKSSLDQINYKIAENVKTINRFSKNERVLRSLEYIQQYIEKFKD